MAEVTGEAKEWLDDIEYMIDSEEYAWAEDTLYGIGEWIEENDHITEKQKNAIRNIKNSR